MAKTRGACFSTHAEGTIGDVLTYQKSLSTPSVKANKFKKYVRSEKQGFIRNQFAFIVSLWHELDIEKKQQWNQYTHYTHLYGYHAFIKLFFGRTYTLQYQYELPPEKGFCIVGNHYVEEFLCGGGFVSSPWLEQLHDCVILDILVSYWYSLSYQLKIAWALQDLEVELVSRYQFVYINNGRIKNTEHPYEHPDGHGFCIVGNHLTGDFFVDGGYYPLW